MGTMRCNYQRSLCFANFADAIRLDIPFTNFREAFKLFDRNRDGFIDMRELKKVASLSTVMQLLTVLVQVTSMLGTMLTKEELDEFMREADVVRQPAEEELYTSVLSRVIISGWEWEAGL